MTPTTRDFDLHGVVRLRVLDATPADVAKASMMGLSEYVARSGASSVRV